MSTKLCKEHPWVNGIQFRFNEGLCPFLKWNNSNNTLLLATFENLLQNRCANFTLTWHKLFLSKGNSSFFKQRTVCFSKVDNSCIVKTHWRLLKFFFWKCSTQESLAFALQTKGRAFQSQPRQTKVVKTGSDSSTAKRFEIGVSVTGPQELLD